MKKLVFEKSQKSDATTRDVDMHKNQLVGICGMGEITNPALEDSKERTQGLYASAMVSPVAGEFFDCNRKARLCMAKDDKSTVPINELACDSPYYLHIVYAFFL